MSTNPAAEDFVRDVHDALNHFYDYAHLECHPLAERLVSAEMRSHRTRAQETRRILLDAIEALNPGDNVPLRAPERRAYSILFGLYVEGREPAAVAAALGIGERQLRRDRASAVDALSTILLDRYPPRDVPIVEDEDLRSESQRLAQQQEMVELAHFVEKLLPLLTSLAEAQDVAVRSGIATDFPLVQTNQMLLRQILLGLASHLLTRTALAQLVFVAQRAERQWQVGVQLHYSDVESRMQGSPLLGELAAVETMTSVLGATLDFRTEDEQVDYLWVSFPVQQEVTVLVIDDNHDLFDLFQRYLVGHPYQLIHAADVEQALLLARSSRPAVITLDLMMPARDGWEFLQLQRADPALRHIPVIVCSVLIEPELAFSLGASGYLKKPIGASELLVALQQVQSSAWAGEARRVSPAPSSTPPTD